MKSTQVFIADRATDALLAMSPTTNFRGTNALSKGQWVGAGPLVNRYSWGRNSGHTMQESRFLVKDEVPFVLNFEQRLSDAWASIRIFN